MTQRTFRSSLIGVRFVADDRLPVTEIAARLFGMQSIFLICSYQNGGREAPKIDFATKPEVVAQYAERVSVARMSYNSPWEVVYDLSQLAAIGITPPALAVGVFKLVNQWLDVRERLARQRLSRTSRAAAEAALQLITQQIQREQREAIIQDKDVGLPRLIEATRALVAIDAAITAEASRPEQPSKKTTPIRQSLAAKRSLPGRSPSSD